MSHRLRYDAQWVKNAAGVYVQAEPISAALMASASTDQVVAKKSDGTLYLKTVSDGGGSTPDWVIGDPRTPPASPNAKDDEFPGSSLDAKWTQVNLTGVTLAVAHERLSLTVPASAGAFNLRSIQQAVPATPWKAETRLRISAGGTFPYAGLCVRDAAGKYVTCGKLVAGATNGVPTSMTQVVEYMTNVTTRSSEPRSVACAIQGLVCLRLRDDGTNLYADWNWDGDPDGWVNYWSAARGVFIGTPTHFGVCTDNIGSAGHVALFDYFRVS